MGVKANPMPQKDGNEVKLSCQAKGAQIIIEVNTTVRGYLFEPQVLAVAENVQDTFEQFAEIMVISNCIEKSTNIKELLLGRQR